MGWYERIKEWYWDYRRPTVSWSPAYVLSVPMPHALWKGENPLSDTKFMLKVVANAEDRHLQQVEPAWRVRQCRRDFARGAWCIITVDTETDQAVGKLWVVEETQGANPWRGPHVRLAADEQYIHSLWVDPAYRRTGVALGLAAEYTAQHALRSHGVNWLHVLVENENVASRGLLIDGWHMWESQEVTILKIGPKICVKVPFSDKPRFGPFSRRGRHSGAGNRVPGRPEGWERASGDDWEPTKPIAEVVESLAAGPDWK